jgi:ABC-type glycerol-3-phosphate transport system substrate-binding protein
MKRKKGLRATALLLSAVMMLTMFAGCGDKEEEGIDPNATVYVASYQDLAVEGLQYINTAAMTDDTIYANAQMMEETDNGEMKYVSKLLKIPAGGGEMQELKSFRIEDEAPGMEGDVSISGLQTAEDGSLWMIKQVYSYSFNLPDDYDPETDERGDYYVDNGTTTSLLHLSPEGETLAEIALQDVLEEGMYPTAFQIADDGTIYLLCSWQAVYALDANGSVLFKVEHPNLYDTILRLNDGSVAVLRWSDQAEFCKIDKATQSFGETIPFTATNFNRFYTGDEKYDFYYDNQNSVFGYDIESQTSEKLFDWLSADVDGSNISYTRVGADGIVTALSNEWDDNTGEQTVSVVTLTPKKASEVEQKKILTLATMYMDYQLRGLVLDFNRTNPTYRIEVRDYSEFNTQDDYSAGQTKLATEIISGNVPDILAVNGLPIDQYAAKGLLEDLWPYIDGDTELGGRDALMPQVFNALTTEDGKLYEITPSVSINTLLGLSDVVGTEIGWTWDDMKAALAKLPEGATVFNPSVTKLSGMSMLCYQNLDQFVNWETGECSFDSQDFINILEFVNQFPTDYNWDENGYEDDTERIKTGRQLMTNSYISDFTWFLMEQVQYGGNVTYVGYPSTQGGGGLFSMDSSYAMSAKCANKEGAWEFMRQFLTKEYQKDNIWSLPTNKECFDEKLKEVMTPQTTTDENGNVIEVPLTTWYVDDQEIEVMAMTQEQADELMAVLDSTTRIARYDENISNIISEETEAYFAGQRSAQDTANMIQSRVKLYVNEQR